MNKHANRFGSSCALASRCADSNQGRAIEIPSPLRSNRLDKFIDVFMACYLSFRLQTEKPRNPGIVDLGIVDW